MGCKGTTASFIIESWRSLHLQFDSFIPKIGVLHGLLQGINSSFKFSEMGFNPSLTSSFSGYYFLCGNKCRSLNLATTGIAFGARPTDFPSAHTLGFTFCSIKGSEREDFIFMKTEAWTLLCISLPKCSEGDLARSETLVKIAQSLSYSLKNKWNNTFWLIQTVPLWKRIRKKMGQGLQ